MPRSVRLSAGGTLSSTSRVGCLLVVLALTGCGQSGPTPGEPASEAGPGIADLDDCDDVRGYYVDAMTTAKNIGREDEARGHKLPGRSVDDSIYVAQRAVERMHELGCPHVPRAPR
jgi:hypothetical protein